MKHLTRFILTESDNDCMLVIDDDALPAHLRADTGALQWRYDETANRALIGGANGPAVAVPLVRSTVAANEVLRKAMATRPLMLQIGYGLPMPIQVPVAAVGWGSKKS